MYLCRRTRLLTVFCALCGLLFTQWAVANYVCPSAIGGSFGSPATVAVMPCAEPMAMPMDAEQPGLCHAHCHAEKQSLDKYEAPRPVTAAALPADFTVRVLAPVFAGAALQAAHLTATTAPPLAIQNCCFRI